MSKTSTQLSFITSEGTVTCTFEPVLAPDHYSELFELMKSERMKEQELCALLVRMAGAWNVKIVIDRH